MYNVSFLETTVISSETQCQSEEERVLVNNGWRIDS